jgi:2-C-methyl-D-erythritol 4-phosphate cytidylyltransferase
MKIVALILAAGQGRRMGTARKKPYLLLGGKPVVYYTLFEFEQSPLIDEIVLVVGKVEVEYARSSLVDAFQFKKVSTIVAGGLKRQDSVWEGLRAVKSDCEVVMVHDGVRPFISQALLERTCRAMEGCVAAIVAVPVKDTIKSVSPQREVLTTLDRSTLWAIQTPQAFRRDILEKAFRQAIADRFYATDDAALVERLGEPVTVVEGSYDNIKITTPEDLVLGETILIGRGRSCEIDLLKRSQETRGMPKMS